VRHPQMIGLSLATSAANDSLKLRRSVSLRIWLRPAVRAVWPGHLRGTKRPPGRALPFWPWQPRNSTPRILPLHDARLRGMAPQRELLPDLRHRFQRSLGG
jgi:hypothetical protein